VPLTPDIARAVSKLFFTQAALLKQEKETEREMKRERKYGKRGNRHKALLYSKYKNSNVKTGVKWRVIV